MLGASRSGQYVDLQCQPHVAVDQLGEIAEGAAFTAQRPPDLRSLLDDQQALRELADAMSGGDAPGFGVTTGSPISATDYVDQIPGSGRNRYFYKMRAVFPGEIRSAWSNTSVGFHQVDLSPAEPPEIVRVDRRGGVSRLMLRWPEGRGVEGVRLLRLTDEGYTGIADWLLDPPAGSKRLTPAPVRALGRLLDLRPMSGSEAPSLTGEPRIVGIYPASPDNGTIDETADLLSGAVLGRTALQLAEASEGAIAVRIRYSSSDIRTFTELAGLAEIEIEADSAADGNLWIQILRSVAVGDGTVRRDSAPVEVR